MKCSVCSPRICAPHFLYVVFDPERSASKIGMSKKPVRRYSIYRKRIGKHIELRHYRESGCEFRTMDKEDKCIRSMSRRFTRLNGDWFLASPEDAESVLNSVLGA